MLSLLVPLFQLQCVILYGLLALPKSSSMYQRSMTELYIFLTNQSLHKDLTSMPHWNPSEYYSSYSPRLSCWMPIYLISQPTSNWKVPSNLINHPLLHYDRRSRKPSSSFTVLTCGVIQMIMIELYQVFSD